jgi:hypothetical protein
VEIKINIFYLHNDPVKCAEMHVDRHVVKMIIEYAQLLSTAHRVLDGEEVIGVSKTGRKAKRWQLLDKREDTVYKATHINHPSAVWARQSKQNYQWLYSLWIACLQEYTYRYGKVHSCNRLVDSLCHCPSNLKEGAFSPPTPAMPDEFKVSDIVQSYRNYYNGSKTRMFKWKLREAPDWVISASA